MPAEVRLCSVCGEATDWDGPDEPLCVKCWDAGCDGRLARRRQMYEIRHRNEQILALWRAGVSPEKLEAAFGISRRVIYRLITPRRRGVVRPGVSSRSPDQGGERSTPRGRFHLTRSPVPAGSGGATAGPAAATRTHPPLPTGATRPG